MPSQTEIADALGLTRQRVSVLVKQGMPVDSVEAASAWRQARDDERRRPAPVVDLGTLTDLTLELIALEAELERRRVTNAEFISAKEATAAMRELIAEVVNRLDKLALDCAEGCNPESPAKAVKTLEAWTRKTREELSRASG